MGAAHCQSPADAMRSSVVADAYPRMAYHHVPRYPGGVPLEQRQRPTLQGQRRPRHHKVLPKRVLAAAVPIPTGPVHRNGLSPFSRNPRGVLSQVSPTAAVYGLPAGLCRSTIGSSPPKPGDDWEVGPGLAKRLASPRSHRNPMTLVCISLSITQGCRVSHRQH